jgi:hypothetical protein
MNEKQQLRQLAKLGIEDFETVEDVTRMQSDLLLRLRTSSIDPDCYAGLDDCRVDYCGRVNCLEACPFGSLRRRLRQVPAALRLLQNAQPPFHEVRVSRALWSRPFGKLDEASVAAAKQLNGRALDSLYIRKGAVYDRESVIAVGRFKVAPSPPHDVKRWICEIHQVVAGALKEELERALSTRGYRGEIRTKLLNPFEDYLRVKEIQDLGPVVSEVLRCDLSGWQYPWRHEIPPEPPTKAQRREFYGWLLDLSPRARLIRYGCDKNFKNLERRPRKPPPPAKGPRRRPSPPEWSRFGSDERERLQMDPNSSDYIGRDQKSPPRPSRMDDRLAKYFRKSNMEYYND